MVIKSDAQGLEESKCHPSLQKQQEGGLKELIANTTSITGKMMKSLIMEAISIHMEDKKVVKISQHGFTKGKSYLYNLIAFYNETSMEEERAVDIVYLSLSKIFDIVSHNILIGKLRKCELNEWTVRWIENCLNGRSQRVVISVAEPSWRPVTSGVSLKLQYWFSMV
ncbi:RNA-directed DNA polymerase from mobile element jockey-like protein [Pitangus sulphuratus]|nr:RNA-directed DNA polymerase from mobile element jockey-like protein [Pitangus sulphuratus]